MLSYRGARRSRMDMKKRIHLELRNRTPSDVSSKASRISPRFAPRTQLMENLSCDALPRRFAKFARNLRGDRGGGGTAGSHRGEHVYGRRELRGGRRWNFCAAPVWRWRLCDPSVAPRLNASGIHKASGVRSHICNFVFYLSPSRLNPRRFAVI